MKLIGYAFALAFAFAFPALPQTGDGFDLSHNVIASGGGSNSTGVLGGATYRVDGTAGQGITGTDSSAPDGTGVTFTVRGGFWAFQALAPTAAGVTVSGRVLTADGRPIGRAYVVIFGGETPQTAISNPFGFYRFDDIAAGTTYVIDARHKQFQFVPRVINVLDTLSDLDFIALP